MGVPPTDAGLSAPKTNIGPDDNSTSVALFGFEYDEDFLKVLGEPWEGVRSAERLLEQEAVQRKRTVQEVRGEKQGLYDRWILEQAEEEASGASRQAEQSPPRGESGG